MNKKAFCIVVAGAVLVSVSGMAASGATTRTKQSQAKKPTTKVSVPTVKKRADASKSVPKAATPQKPPVLVAPVKPLDTPVVSKSRLTPAQVAAIEDALKTLRKLDAATKVGVTQTSYQDRLIDAKAQVDEDLPLITGDVICTSISDSMQAYQDASIFWSECLQLKSRSSIKYGESGKILKKYQIDVPDQGKDEMDAFYRDHDECTRLQQDPDTASTTLDRQDELTTRMYRESLESYNINGSDEKMVLSSIWKIARQNLTDAEDQLKNASTAPL